MPPPSPVVLASPPAPRVPKTSKGKGKGKGKEGKKGKGKNQGKDKGKSKGPPKVVAEGPPKERRRPRQRHHSLKGLTYKKFTSSTTKRPEETRRVYRERVLKDVRGFRRPALQGRLE